MTAPVHPTRSRRSTTGWPRSARPRPPSRRRRRCWGSSFRCSPRRRSTDVVPRPASSMPSASSGSAPPRRASAPASRRALPVRGLAAVAAVALVVRSRSQKVRAAAEAVLRVLDDAIAVLVESHQAARRDDPSRGGAAGGVRRRPAPGRRRHLTDGGTGRAFRHRLGKAHHVALVAPGGGEARRSCCDLPGARHRRPVRRPGRAVATKDSRVVVVVPATSPSRRGPPPSMWVGAPAGTPSPTERRSLAGCGRPFLPRCLWRRQVLRGGPRGASSPIGSISMPTSSTAETCSSTGCSDVTRRPSSTLFATSWNRSTGFAAARRCC